MGSLKPVKGKSYEHSAIILCIAGYSINEHKFSHLICKDLQVDSLGFEAVHLSFFSAHTLVSHIKQSCSWLVERAHADNLCPQLPRASITKCLCLNGQ